MSKKLDTIIRKVPPAVVTEENHYEIQSVRNIKEKQERVVAVIPASLKKQIKLYLMDHPGETEKTLLLKGLLALGFKIEKDHLIDARGKR